MPEVTLEEVRRFMEDSLKVLGAPDSEAKAHADLLVHADTVGHYSHGLNRLGECGGYSTGNKGRRSASIMHK